MKRKTIEERAADNFISSLESLLIALSQREMSEVQLDRLAVVLQRAELDALERCTMLVVADGSDADAALSTG